MRRTIRLFARFKGSPKIYIVGMTLLVFEAATAVIEPYPIAWLIDFLGGNKPNLRELGGPAFLALGALRRRSWCSRSRWC